MGGGIFIALGWNIWDSCKLFDQSIVFLKNNNITVLQESHRYISEPMYHLDQEKFLNSVIEIETKLSPMDLLTVCQNCEAYVGREKTFINWPRIIDLDILLYRDTTVKHSLLKIPHPKIWERDFVIFPLHDLSPHIKIWKEEVRFIIKKFNDSNIEIFKPEFSHDKKSLLS